MKQHLLLSLLLSLFSFCVVQAQSISADPDSGFQQEFLTVNISGVGTQFQSGTSTCGPLYQNSVVFRQGSETINLQSINVVDDELVTAHIYISSYAPSGDYDIVIWENAGAGCEVSCDDCFEVIDPSNGSITEIDNSTAAPGEELKVTISGENTYWSQASPCSINAGNVIFTQGTSTIFTPENVVILDTDTLCAFITVPNNVDLGLYDLTIGDGLGCETSCEDCFNISNGLYVDQSATGNNDGSSWVNAFTDLQDALAVGVNERIYIAQGIYLPTSGTTRGASFIIPSNANLIGGYSSGGETRDVNTYKTILSGEIDGIPGFAGNSYHVVKLQNVSGVILDGLDIKDGSADNPSSFGRSRGGGIFSTGSSATIINTTLRRNKAVFGGAIFATLSPNLVLDSCTIKLNTAGNGSALYHSNQTNVIMNNCYVVDNNSTVRCAIEINNSLYTEINNSVIANNASLNANAIGFIATNRDQSCNIYNSTILGESQNKSLISLQIGFNDVLDVNIYNSIIAHQTASFNKNAVVFNNGTLNFNTTNCYIQGSSIIGNTSNNIYENIVGAITYDANYAPNNCSPTVNAGNNANTNSLTTDFNGNNRIMAGTVDIGAHEAQMSCRMMFKEVNDLSTITVFPNPTNGELNIQTLEENITISIFDILGKRIIHTTEKEINISSFPSGLYILNIEKAGETIHVEKLIKE